MDVCTIPENYKLLNPLEQSLLGLMILVIMFGMGAGLTGASFRYVLKAPKGVIIGFLSQFGIMPFVAFALATVLKLDPMIAIALILVGSIPAGTTSNMFTYFSRGDLALSITMTTCSTIAAVFMTPLMLKLYAGSFTSQIDLGGAEFQIPFRSIVQSLVLVLVPVGLGMTLRRFSSGWAKAAEDTASFMGIIVILFLIGMFLIDPTKRCMMAATELKTYVGAIGVGLGGFLFGYLASSLMRMEPRHRRTVALETGIQNGPLAFAIVILSFGQMNIPGLESKMLWLPILYSFFIVITSSFVTLFFRKIGKQDWEVYENTEVQKRLFGETWKPFKT